MTRFFLRHPVTTWMIFTAFVVLGLYSIPRLTIEAVPEVSLPTLTVRTRWSGASPRAVQRSITLPIEEAARNVHGVENVRSTSRAGESQVEIELRRGVDIDFGRLELNEELGSVRRTLPLGATPPAILPYVPEEFRSEDFFTFALESALPPNELRDLAETWITPQIMAIEGVADAQVQGGANPLVKIRLDRTRLDFLGIRAEEVFSAITELDAVQGAGAVYRDGEEQLVALRNPVDLERLQNAVVVRRGERMFTLSMLGDVEATYEDPQFFIRTNTRNVVRIRVEKRSGANSVTVSRTLRRELPAIEARAPFDVRFSIDNDEGRNLYEKLMELVSRSAVILAVLFLLLIISLRQVRLTAVVMASIVFAILISLSLFYFFGLTVNFVTISGLTVCFGLILDNSILVLDAIHRRLVALKRAEAADFSRRALTRVAFRTIVDGAEEVLFPILSTTLTTIVAFLSFIFLSGRLALFYVPLAVAVATAMAASIFVAFIWIPVVLNQGWARHAVKSCADGPRDDVSEQEVLHAVRDDPGLNLPPSRLEKLFGWFQRLWWIVLPATVVLLIWSGKVYDEKVIKGGFWRMPSTEDLTMYLEMPAGTDIAVTSEIALGFEESLLPIPDGATANVQVFGGNRAFMRVRFEDDLRSTEVPLKYRALLVDQADRTGGASIFINGFSDQPYIKGPFRGSALNSLVEISGYNSKRLNEVAEGALRRVQRQRRARNARITTGGRFERSFNDESVIWLDRDLLAQHGMTVAEAAMILRRLLGVDQPWRMVLDGAQERVQLAFADADELEYAEIAHTLVTTPSGERVRIGDLGTIEQRPLSGSITRENQRYTVSLNWEYIGTDKMRRRYIAEVLAGLDLPYGFSAEEAERTFFTEEEEEELALTLILAVVFIYIILAALFESASLPLMVLFSLPLALVGVILIFWQTNTEFDSSARIGLVLLFGIVVNNAILLVSRFRNESQLILDHKGLVGTRDTAAELGCTDLARVGSERATLLRRAIARGTRVRLRSILLTSGTTIVGLAPLLLPLHEFLPLPRSTSSTEGSDIWDNLALSSIGGLVSSTVLLIVVMPALMYAVVRFWWIFGRFVRPVLRLVGGAAVTAIIGAAALALLRPDTPWLAVVASWLRDHRAGVLVDAVNQVVGAASRVSDPTALAILAVAALVLAVLTLLPWTASAASTILALGLLLPIVIEVGQLATPHPTLIALVAVLVGLAYSRRAQTA